VFWAGDSRGYVFAPDGAKQLTVDDLRDPSDAMTNLRRDSVVSNAMSADTEFHVNYRRVKLEAPFLLVSATDGCFGYVPSPMHFEQLVLGHLVRARSVKGWSSAIQADIAAVTGDDAAMSVMAVGADLAELRTLYAGRVRELEKQYTGPIDEMDRAVSRAEQELQALRQRQADDSQRLWTRYQPTYEQFLRVQEEARGPDDEQEGVLDHELPADDSSEPPEPPADGVGSTGLTDGSPDPEEVSR